MTLFEVAATLAVMGILAAGAASVLTGAVEGALESRNQSTSAENIQAALTRITHEIANMDIKRSYSFNSTSISYYYRASGSQSTIQLSGTNLLLNGQVLLSGLVSGSGFQVTAPNYITSPAVPAQVSLTVQVPTVGGSVSRTFTAKISLNTQRWQ